MTRSLTIGLLLAFASALFAQTSGGNKDAAANDAKPEAKVEAKADANAEAKTETTVKEETTEKAAPAGPNYSGDIWKRSKLTGDWGGFRNDLAAKGVTLDVDVMQTLQGNAHGGVSTNNGIRYSGGTDYTLTLDTAKMGLWKGGTILLHAENKWGNGIQDKVGALLPVNLRNYKPIYGDECVMSLSEYIYFQSLFDGKLVLIAGKLDGSRAFDRNVFANDERSQFMNLGFRNNPLIGAFLPYTNLGVGAIVNPTDWLSVITAVADSEGRATTTGFETAFHGDTDTTVIQEFAAKVKPFNLDGNQRLGFLYSCKNYNHLQPISPFRQTGPALYNALGPKLFGNIAKFLPYEQSSDNTGIYYNFDQFVYQEKEDPSQGVGLFGRFGWARQDVNPIAHFYSIGVGGKGVIPTRDQDQFGVGYYFSDLSNDLPYWFHSEQGIEAYYRIQITPWLHISPDLQVITNPGGTGEHDVALVYGLRMFMSL